MSITALQKITYTRSRNFHGDNPVLTGWQFLETHTGSEFHRVLLYIIIIIMNSDELDVMPVLYPSRRMWPFHLLFGPPMFLISFVLFYTLVLVQLSRLCPFPLRAVPTLVDVLAFPTKRCALKVSR